MMTNAERFKSIFGLYATEVWAMPENNFLKWLNAEAVESEPIVRCKDCRHIEERAFKTEDGDILEFEYCNRWKASVKTEGFCYKGYRRDEVEDGKTVDNVR